MSVYVGQHSGLEENRELMRLYADQDFRTALSVACLQVLL